jgi:uncharacterized delta-60 repeat protein/uncharacterized repeat protein (TIGR01451 family)
MKEKSAKKAFLITAIILLLRDPAFGAAVLDAKLTLIPSTVSVGQQITMIMNVTNSGTDNALTVTAQNLVKIGPGGVSYVSGPSPAAQAINAGGNGSVTWIYTASSPGCFSFSANAEGTDAASLLTVTGPTTGSNGMCIETPASLACQINSVPATASNPQLVTVVMSVTNSGQAGAVNVCGQAGIVQVSGTPGASLNQSPSCVSIAGGAAAYFTWVYMVSFDGTLAFTMTAKGNDVNSGAGVSSGTCMSNNVEMQEPIFFLCSVDAFPDAALYGGDITVIMTLSNTGEAAAINVFPNTPSLSGMGTAVLAAGPLPASMSILGGAAGYFTWVYSAGLPGSVSFNIWAQGTDANSGVTRLTGPGCNDSVIITDITPTHTLTPTISPTVTPTQCVGEGSAVINPVIAYAGTSGNTFTITYTAGATVWAGPPNSGMLKISIPPGWSPPSLISSARGYFTVTVSGGTVKGFFISGQDIIINVEDLAANIGQITVVYGASVGATIPSGGCPMGEVVFFDIESSTDGHLLCPITADPMVGVACNTPTYTKTPTITFTPTPLITETYTRTITLTPTNTPPSGPTPCFITRWGSSGLGNGQFMGAFGIAVDTGGNVYVADSSNNRVQKFDSSGNYLTQWGGFGTGPGQFDNPFGIAVDSSGNVYVSEMDNNRIQKFTSTGVYVSQWGSFGSGAGQFNAPAGITVDNSGDVYVVEYTGNRVQKFTSNGVYLTGWSASFGNPMGIAADSSGNIYVADNGNYRIQKFTSAGVFTASWGSNGTGNGQFVYPAGIAVDGAGNIYTSENINCRIQKFTPTGGYITKWGSSGSGSGQFNDPRGIAVDTAGNIYVIDLSMNVVHKFGPCVSPTPTCSVSPSATVQSPSMTETVSFTPALSKTMTVTMTPTATITLSATKIPTTTMTPTWTITTTPWIFPTTTPSPAITNTPGTPAPIATETACVHRDAAFNLDGIVAHNNAAGGNGSDYGLDMTLAADGKIIVTGESAGIANYDMAVWRYNTDGTLDTTFGGAGFVTSDNTAGGNNEDVGWAVTTDASGRIIVSGYSDGPGITGENMVVWRFNADGTTDTTFNGTGYVISAGVAGGNGSDIGHSVVVDGNGKIVVAGRGGSAASGWDMVIWRYNSDGSPDLTFNGSGHVVHSGAAGGNNNDIGYKTLIDSNGRILVAGVSQGIPSYHMTIWRYNSNGTLDTTFNGTGYVFDTASACTGRSISIDGSGKILVCGYNSGNFMTMWRYNQDGTPDTSFGGTGRVSDPEPSAVGADVITDGSGKILVSGYTYAGNWTMTVWKYNADGTKDTGFDGIKDTATTGSRGAAIEADSNGRIIIAGNNATGAGPDDMVIWVYDDGCAPTPTPTPPGASTLSILKSVAGEAPAIGAVIRYEIQIRNTDTKPAYNLAVWDTLPVQVDFLNNLSGVPYVKNGQYIRWDLSAEPAASPLNPGDALFIEFDCRIVSLSGSVPIANYAGCDYYDGTGKHAPIFSQLVFYPLDIPAVYPNPATDYVKFTNIVPGSQVEIFTLSGEFVNSIPAQSVVVLWDLTNRFNGRVSAGIYYYLIRDAKGKVGYKGKIFIVKTN